MTRSPLIIAACAAVTACAAPYPASPQDPPATAPTEAPPATAQAPAEVQGLEPTPDSYAHTGHRTISTPVSNPFTFETPINETSLRAIFLWNDAPISSTPLQGGDVRFFALQARVALTDELGINITRASYIDIQPGVGPDQTGLSDLAVGLKYVLLDDPKQRAIVTAGLNYTIPSGNANVVQGNGDGILRPYISAAQEYGHTNLLTSIAYNQPLDGDAHSSSLDYHGQVEWEVTDALVPFFAVHGILFTSNGTAIASNNEGNDLFNFGSNNVDGQSVFSAGAGARFRITPDMSVGASYDFPLGGRSDLLAQRLTFDAMIHF